MQETLRRESTIERSWGGVSCPFRSMFGATGQPRKESIVTTTKRVLGHGARTCSDKKCETCSELRTTPKSKAADKGGSK